MDRSEFECARHRSKRGVGIPRLRLLPQSPVAQFPHREPVLAYCRNPGILRLPAFAAPATYCEQGFERTDIPRTMESEHPLVRSSNVWTNDREARKFQFACCSIAHVPISRGATEFAPHTIRKLTQVGAAKLQVS